MEKKSKGAYLEKALDLAEKSVKRIVVVEDAPEYIKKQLDEQKFNEEDDFILNITGGTKVMAIAVYEYFQNKKSKFYYVPIGKNVIKDMNTLQTTPLRYRLNLSEYLTLNSLHYEYDNTLLCDEHTTFAFFNQLKRNNFWRNNQIKYAQEENTPELKRYYSGAWFEEYVYLRIKNDFGLKDDAIAMSVKV